jgi:hypothetical protein
VRFDIIFLKTVDEANNFKLRETCSWEGSERCECLGEENITSSKTKECKVSKMHTRRRSFFSFSEDK